MARSIDAAGSAETLAAFETPVGMEAAEAANDRSPMLCHLYALIGYAQMLDTHGRGEQASLVRHEALTLLTWLADTGERNIWSAYQTSFWGGLAFSGAERDRPAPDGPRPPSGAAPMRWSDDAKRRRSGSLHALREEVDALAPRGAEDPDRRLAELVRLHRVLTVRSAVHGEWRTHQFTEHVRSLFDDGVRLARRLYRHDPAEGARALARILIDRSAFHAAARDLGLGLDDFRQALRHLGGGRLTRPRPGAAPARASSSAPTRGSRKARRRAGGSAARGSQPSGCRRRRS